VSRSAGLALLLVAASACGLPEPAPLTRVVSAAPEGPGISPALAEAEIRFTGPVDEASLEDGARLVLVPASALRAALVAVESDEGAGALGERVAASLSLDDGGRRVVLRPAAALRAHLPYALVLSSRARAADGRPVLDPEGRQRPFVCAFETGAAPGPPPRPVLTEVRADAETPEAGGEYVEIANLGEGDLDLFGFRLAKRTSSGALSSCALAPRPEDAVPPGGLAIAVGGAYDGRYALPAGTPVVPCGAVALLGGIANDRAPEILLVDPAGEIASSFGAGGGAPMCVTAAVRVEPEGPDAPWNLACAEGEGTPGTW
jgi:hypothetical protein